VIEPVANRAFELYHSTARLNRGITITRYESDDPTVGPRVREY
jgi:hypothetical protein